MRLTDNLTMPDNSSRNLLINPSFEQGFLGYFLRDPGMTYSKRKWETEQYEIVKNEHAFGSSALKINTIYPAAEDYRSLTTCGSMASHHAAVDPGIYTLSFSFKGDHPGEQTVNVWVAPYNYGQYFYWEAVPNGKISVQAEKEWKRCSMTFRIDSVMPLSVRFNAVSTKRRGSVFMDGFQLEKRDHATAFEVKAVEGRLRTSDPGNFISSSADIDGRLELQTAPGVSGKGIATAKNFYGEEVFRQKFSFQADAAGRAVVPLDFDKRKPGKGLLMLRTDYELDNGKKCYDLHRFTILDYLENKHPNRFIFSDDFGSHALIQPRLYLILDRYRKIGFGGKTSIYTFHPLVFETYKKFGLEISEAVLTRHMTVNGKKHFCIKDMDSDEGRNGWKPVKPNDPNILLRDFHLDAGGEVTPEYLLKLRNVCETLARKYPNIIRWQFANEIRAAFPLEWWSKEGTMEKYVEKFAKILKAFSEGIRAGNPKAEISADSPWNMNPEGGIVETEALLKECNKLGFKLDRLACHTYRTSPEDPDLDADTALYLEKISKNGYAKEPIFWTEMMYYGPYEIPAWGVYSAEWMGAPREWFGGAVSYDLGWTEKISAAWRARSWLVALKYSDRVKTACSSSTNNFNLDYDLTPTASQLISNTLGNLLGNAVFKKDIRFAAYIRSYIFEDAQKRPVAAVWCHLPKLDKGLQDAPIARADFGNALESVFDLMNNPRSFKPGKMDFAVSSFPLFFRGKPGTRSAMEKAFEQTVIVSGEGVFCLKIAANPVSPDEAELKITNLLSIPFSGKIENKEIAIEGAQTKTVRIPLPAPLKYDAVETEKLSLSIEGKQCGTIASEQTFRGMLCKRVAEDITQETIDWKNIPSVQLSPLEGKPASTEGRVQTAWNRKGFFVRIAIRDAKFFHLEFPIAGNRWANDCVQLYFDTMADARSNQVSGYDTNDCEYWLLPNSAGTKGSLYRARMVNWQLGLATSQPKVGTFAEDIPVGFAKTSDGYVYTAFFPAKDLLPVVLKKGYVFGFGIYAPNADGDSSAKNRVHSALTNDSERTGCFARPSGWPALLLWD